MPERSTAKSWVLGVGVLSIALLMGLLGVPPGPVVGAAYRWLLERRLDRGPVPAEVARDELLQWWAAQSRPEPPA